MLTTLPLFTSIAIIHVVPSTRPPSLSLDSTMRRADLIAAASAKDFTGEAANMFNNIRTPAALVAGATFGGVFALQPIAADKAIVGLAKRVHMLIGVVAFSAELISVLVSSITLGRLGSSHAPAEGQDAPAHTSVQEFLRARYELEWLATEFNFLLGLLGLTSMVGIRAWVAFACPLFGKIAVGFVVSSLLTMLAFAQQGGNCALCQAPRYLVLLVSRAYRERSLLFAAALGVGATSAGFFLEAAYKILFKAQCGLS